MLPGFRFLFAAIMLSMSILVFGLGAAALLRAAHEQFASNSSWRAAPEVKFVQASEGPPVLAMLRLEVTAEEQKPSALIRRQRHRPSPRQSPLRRTSPTKLSR